MGLLNRQNYYYRQKVTEADLDNLENNLESALRNSIIDLFGVGMVAGGDVQQNSPTPDMSVIVTPGKGYDFLGQRIAWSTSQNVDCSKDKDGTPTAVTTQGNEKWITVLAYFTRFYSDPRVDGHGNVVYFKEDEGYTFKVIQGAEAPIGQAQRPAHPTDGGLILADIRLTYGVTAITNSMIDKTRYEDIVTHTASEIQVVDAQGRFAGNDVESVLAEIDQALDNHAALMATAHGGIVPSSDVVTSPQANKILRLDSQAKLPASITGDSDTVDNKHASDFAPASHVGATGSAHGLATPSVAGFMSASDKTKLDSVQSGAEPNQNAFSQIKIGATTVDADSKTDSVEFVAGPGMSLIPDAVNDKVTFAVAMDDTVHGNRGGGSLHSVATSSIAGFMSAFDKAKLDGIASGAEVNQNAFSFVKAVDSTGASKGQADADAKTDILTLKEGNNVTLAVDPATDTVTISALVGAHASTHITGGIDVIPNAVAGGASGLMSGADKQKLDSIQAGAEVNQNAFSSVAVADSAGNPKAGSPCAADSKTDTLTLKEGPGIALSIDSTTDTVTITATGGVAPAAHASTHVMGGSDVIPNAVAGGASGLMSGADKAKLDGIQAGAEVNQNAFSQIKVGATTIDADSKTDTLELVAGANIALTPDATNDRLTIAVTGTVPQAGNADTVDNLHASDFAPAGHVGAGGSAHASATSSIAGFMSPSDKAKLDGIQTGAEVNQNAFSQIKVGPTTIDADSKTDILELAAGDSITLTPDPANDKVTISVQSSNFAPASHMGSGGSAHAEATTSVAGFMSAADKAKLNGLGKVSVIMGTISHGAVLPLPSGYAQSECWWIVSNNNSDTGGDAIGGLRIWVDPSTRVVTAQRRMEYNLSLQNITANYLVIGVKPS
ncbi:MAG TPA: hypothetical protein GXX51_05800 [Firmicutes bacterium]|nr:hypothetical protein [Bacillota bacterium]